MLFYVALSGLNKLYLNPVGFNRIGWGLAPTNGGSTSPPPKKKSYCGSVADANKYTTKCSVVFWVKRNKIVNFAKVMACCVTSPRVMGN